MLLPSSAPLPKTSTSPIPQSVVDEENTKVQQGLMQAMRARAITDCYIDPNTFQSLSPMIAANVAASQSATIAGKRSVDNSNWNFGSAPSKASPWSASLPSANWPYGPASSSNYPGLAADPVVIPMHAVYMPWDGGDAGVTGPIQDGKRLRGPGNANGPWMRRNERILNSPSCAPGKIINATPPPPQITMPKASPVAVLSSAPEVSTPQTPTTAATPVNSYVPSPVAPTYANLCWALRNGQVMQSQFTPQDFLNLDMKCNELGYQGNCPTPPLNALWMSIQSSLPNIPVTQAMIDALPQAPPVGTCPDSYRLGSANGLSGFSPEWGTAAMTSGGNASCGGMGLSGVLLLALALLGGYGLSQTLGT